LIVDISVAALAPAAVRSGDGVDGVDDALCCSLDRHRVDGESTPAETGAPVSSTEWTPAETSAPVRRYVGVRTRAILADLVEQADGSRQSVAAEAGHVDQRGVHVERRHQAPRLGVHSQPAATCLLIHSS